MSPYRIQFDRTIWSLYYQSRLVACSYWRDNVERVMREHERKGQLMHTVGGR